MQLTKHLVQAAIDEAFDGYIGQDAAKRKGAYQIEKYAETRRFPNYLLVAQKGDGKTTLARCFAKGLFLFSEEQEGHIVLKEDGKTPKKKPFLIINCASLKNLTQFFNQYVLPYVHEKAITIVFDEASELPHDVSMAMLTIFEDDDGSGKTQYTHNEYTFDFDFSKQTFLFCTTEPQKVFHALRDRLPRIDLAPYSKSELAKIIQRHAKGVKFDDGLLEDITTVTRGNARNAKNKAKEVVEFLGKRTKFTRKDWKELCEINDIKPLGLTPLEIEILRHLAKAPNGASLTNLSAKTGLTRESLQKDVEIYLQRHDLMEIGTTGRQITSQGLEYLKAIGDKIETSHAPIQPVAGKGIVKGTKGKKIETEEVNPSFRPKTSAPVAA